MCVKRALVQMNYRYLELIRDEIYETITIVMIPFIHSMCVTLSFNNKSRNHENLVIATQLRLEYRSLVVMRSDHKQICQEILFLSYYQYVNG